MGIDTVPGTEVVRLGYPIPVPVPVPVDHTQHTLSTVSVTLVLPYRPRRVTSLIWDDISTTYLQWYLLILLIIMRLCSIYIQLCSKLLVDLLGLCCCVANGGLLSSATPIYVE